MLRSTYMQYILVLSIEQPRNAENALLSFGYLSAGPSRQKAEFCLEDERKNIVKLESELLVQQPWKSTQPLKQWHRIPAAPEHSKADLVSAEGFWPSSDFGGHGQEGHLPKEPSPRPHPPDKAAVNRQQPRCHRRDKPRQDITLAPFREVQHRCHGTTTSLSPT